ncbi:MAG: FixH family protein [Leptospiraceae bacterium]|nr:FixH family protein [Leptospiraceae bacterium]
MFSNLHPSLRYSFYMIIGVFLLLFVGTYYTFKVALSQPNELVDKNYYQVGVNYERTIANQKELVKAGYGFEIQTDLSTLKKGDNQIQVSFQKKEEKLVGKKVKIILERGATNKFNETFELNESESGLYSGNINFKDSGKWILTISAKEETGEFQERKIVFVN